tara:strand:- start:631 stop:1101 length:471 start_codon:yes stop_codon:yes gene_type:complete
MEIIGFPNYKIYKNGRVINKYGYELKHILHSNGYMCVCLRNNPIQKTLHIHRLLGIHYIQNPNNLPFIDHKDRNKLNNNLNNLRWVSHLENQQNTGKQKRNTSGHKNIFFRKNRNTWEYNFKTMGRQLFRRTFSSKIDCICFKFICLLKTKSQNLI